MKRNLVSILAFILVFIFIVKGDDIVVSQGESIQSAITNANPGDTVWVKSGNYNENINISKKIFLYGWNTGDGDPIVDVGNGGGSAITLSSGSDGTGIQGFNLKNSNEAGIMVNSNNNYIGYITADHNQYGVKVESSDGGNDIGASIEASTFSQNTYGIYLDSSQNYVIQRNTASNNDYGIYLTSSSGNDILGNDMTNNRVHDSYDKDNTGSNNWDGNRFTNHNSPHKIPGGSSVDENPKSKKPNIPKLGDKRHRSPTNR